MWLPILIGLIYYIYLNWKIWQLQISDKYYLVPVNIILSRKKTVKNRRVVWKNAEQLEIDGEKHTEQGIYRSNSTRAKSGYSTINRTSPIEKKEKQKGNPDSQLRELIESFPRRISGRFD